MFTKARFFKCALQVNPAGYIKYRGQQQSITEDEYNQNLLAATQEAGIEVIGLADHGSVDGVDKIRSLFVQSGIVVFPGFEIASSEKIHFVCLFDESKTSQELERIIGRLDLLDPEDGVRPTNLTAIQLIDKVNEISGFIFAAHSTNDKGVLKLKMNHVWQHGGLRAAQIPGSVEDLRGASDVLYYRAFKNRDEAYSRDREMAAINAADVAKPDDIKNDGASCLIKMTNPCFTSFKQAFLDAGSRVRLNIDKPESFASAIERVRFTGGYLDGVDIELSEHLNAVIGGRGTGKSTFLECIRFALDLEPFGKSAKSQHDAILKNNLGREKGVVELTIRSAAMHGRRFKVSRKWGDQSTVLDDEGNVLPYKPLDLVPGIELYGQNEIYEMTRDPVSRNQLIERFLEGEHDKYDETIQRVLSELKDNRDAIRKSLDKKHDIEADVERLPKLQDQAKQFHDIGLDEKLKVVPKLETEKHLNNQVKESLGSLREAIGNVGDSLPDVDFLSDEIIENLPHSDNFKKQRDVIDQLRNSIEAVKKQIEEQALNADTAIEDLSKQLLEGVTQEEQLLEEAFKEIPASQGKTGRQIGAEYQELLRQIERIRPKQNDLKTRQEELGKLYTHRKKLMHQLSEAISERSSAMQKSVKRLNRRLDQKVKLTLQNEGDRQPLLQFLERCNMEGIGQKRLNWVSELDFTPGNLAGTIRAGEEALKSAGWGITPTVAQGLCKLNESELLEMEELTLPDTMAIELNVTHGTKEAVFRQIDELSTGQQCTAILHLLLLDNQDPLILDQPEDNLDNAFIADRIVSELRRAKLTRQFLFATHNANIPVFGDAEWIGVLSVEDNKGLILPEQQGAIDVTNVQHLAADILEGGKSAFNQRREKYGFI